MNECSLVAEASYPDVSQRAVFLDRDGVINRTMLRKGKPFPPDSLDELAILPGVEEAMTTLSAAGFLLVVVTNQPDVARGVQSRPMVDAIHHHLSSKLPINEFRTCFHDDADDCQCRKPRCGALLAAAREHRIDLATSYMVGDRWRDIAAGEAAGCKTVFVDYGYDELQPEKFDYRVTSLLEASKIILKVN
ncbi:MAG: HAD family hydrolase [Pseudomonadota bacterium]